MCTTPEAPGPRVLADNAGGIRLAVEHLAAATATEHIAFVAGRQHRRGDSAQRVRRSTRRCRTPACAVDPASWSTASIGVRGRPRGHGSGSSPAGAPFSAFVASNDLSCLGAIEALTVAGRRVPEDVAAIGFDDILDARSHTPPLTTVRYPTFALGYGALTELARRDPGGRSPEQGRPTLLRMEPTRLIVRRSCGCPLRAGGGGRCSTGEPGSWPSPP